MIVYTVKFSGKITCDPIINKMHIFVIQNGNLTEYILLFTYLCVFYAVYMSFIQITGAILIFTNKFKPGCLCDPVCKCSAVIG